MEPARPSRAPRIFAILVGTLGIGILPLSYYLPKSKIALVLAVVLLAAINAAAILRLDLGKRALLAQLLNLAIPALGLLLALDSTLSLAVRITVPGFLCGFLYFLVHDRLPTPDSEVYFAVQQLSLGLTLAFWMLVREAAREFENGWQGMDHAIGGSLRLLFIGTLAAVPLTILAGVTGWKRFPSLAAATCFGQIGNGLLDLASHSSWPILSLVGLASLLLFVVLSGIALMPRQGGEPAADAEPPPSQGG